MDKIKFTTKTVAAGAATLVEFELADGVIAPSDLAGALESAPQVDPTKGVIISGRGPVWLFAALAHEYHPCKWVATYDPRLGGAVVVESHHPDAPQVGEVIPL